MAETGERSGFRSLLLTIFYRLTGAMNSIGTVWIFALVFLINADIIGRALFNSPVKGVPELVALSIVGIVYLELATTLRANRFVRSDVFLSRLLANHPRVGFALQAAHHMIGAALAAVILYFTYPKFLLAYAIDEYVGTLGDFTAPVWPIKLIIVVGTFALVIQFLLLFVRDLMVVAGKTPPDDNMATEDTAAP